MTAKRFKLGVDEQYGAILDNDKIMYKGEIVELLNALYEENERLHNEVFRLKTELAYDRTVNDGKDWFKAEDEHLKWKSGEND